MSVYMIVSVLMFCGFHFMQVHELLPSKCKCLDQLLVFTLTAYDESGIFRQLPSDRCDLVIVCPVVFI